MMIKIGSVELHNKSILAPMAGVSDYPFRTICYDLGCELTYSEMVSSEGLVRGMEKTLEYLYRGEEHADKLIAFQIFGSNEDIMADAAEIVSEKGADIIDINMGCPVKKVVKTGAGSALLGDIPLLSKVVTKVRKRLKKPLTVKIRSGWQNEVKAVEISKILEDSGVDAVIVHPRTQKQGFSGKADWSIIEKVKQQIKIPVIGNGDVFSVGDYNRMLCETGCDAVMIGRGAMGKPWVFQFENGNGVKPSPEELLPIIKKHYTLAINFYGESEAIRIMRKHISWYTKGLQDSSRFRQVINKMSNFDELWGHITSFFLENGNIKGKIL